MSYSCLYMYLLHLPSEHLRLFLSSSFPLSLLPFLSLLLSLPSSHCPSFPPSLSLSIPLSLSILLSLSPFSQDHLLISFEQEILRANDKIRNPTLLNNHSLCSVLIERLLPQSNTDDQLNSPAASSDNKGVVVDATKDERLLTGYVQDVWDRFHKETLLIAERQKLEVETLWTIQTNQWKQRIEKCTGTINWMFIHCHLSY